MVSSVTWSYYLVMLIANKNIPSLLHFGDLKSLLDHVWYWGFHYIIHVFWVQLCVLRQVALGYVTKQDKQAVEKKPVNLISP